MPLTFRNVDVGPSADVTTWPFEAVLTALERGGLAVWRRLEAAVRADPWGPLSRKIEQAIDASRPYGVAPLMHDVLAAARAEEHTRERRAVAQQVSEAIRRSGLGRVEFAAGIGTSASRHSTYESGRVMPSAALLLRMGRLADRTSRDPAGP